MSTEELQMQKFRQKLERKTSIKNVKAQKQSQQNVTESILPQASIIDLPERS
jgi:hypothetical protein